MSDFEMIGLPTSAI